MNDAELASQVTAVIQGHLHTTCRPIVSSTRFVDDLGADSLAVVELTLALEEAFEIEIEDDHIETLRTVQDAVRYVARCVAMRDASGAVPRPEPHGAN